MRKTTRMEIGCIKRNVWCIKETHPSLKKEIKGVGCVLSENAGT